MNCGLFFTAREDQGRLLKRSLNQLVTDSGHNNEELP